MIPAYDDNEGLHFRLIDELQSYDKSTKIRARFAGVVLKTVRDERIASFTSIPSPIQFPTARQQLR
jgi:hypothetical protein